MIDHSSKPVGRNSRRDQSPLIRPSATFSRPGAAVPISGRRRGDFCVRFSLDGSAAVAAPGEVPMPACADQWPKLHGRRDSGPAFRRTIALHTSGSQRLTGSRVVKGFTMQVQMQLSRIIISEINERQVIYLREVDGDRQFPILIGIFEATSIDRRVKELASSRPLTHDLLVNIVEQLGAELDSVVITDLRDHTYYAKLRIKQDGELIEIDSRPSDAIAVAVTCNPPLPIYVNEEVLDEAME